MQGVVLLSPAGPERSAARAPREGGRRREDRPPTLGARLGLGDAPLLRRELVLLLKQPQVLQQPVHDAHAEALVELREPRDEGGHEGHVRVLALVDAEELFREVPLGGARGVVPGEAAELPEDRFKGVLGAEGEEAGVGSGRAKPQEREHDEGRKGLGRRESAGGGGGAKGGGVGGGGVPC